jgi:iron complex outermembrane receptor protein
VELEWQCPAEGFKHLLEGREAAVRWVVSAKVARFGGLYLLTLKLFDLRFHAVAGRVVHRILGGPEDLRDELSDATQELFKRAAEHIQLVPTVTVASRRIQLLEESPSAVSVYTREDIRSSGAADLVDFLRRVPGFDIHRLKPASALVGSRAMTSISNNLVLPIIDGREALFEILGFTFWNFLSIDLEEIERLEVIRGPGSALYGANAFAGVVSITTVAHQTESRSDAFMRAGEVGQYRVFGRFRDGTALGKRELSYGAGIGFEGKVSPSDILDDGIQEAFRSHAYISYRQGREMQLSLHGGVAQGQGMFSHVSTIGDWRLPDYLFFWTMAQADFSLGPNTFLKVQSYYSRHDAHQFYRTRISAYDVWLADLPDNNSLSHNIDTKILLDWQIVDNLLLITGANLRYTTVDWDKIFLAPYDEFTGAGFAQVQWRPWAELQLTGGLRLDLNTLTDEALSPRVVAIFLPWKGHSFRLGYGLAFRKPSAYETNAQVTIEDFNQATPEIVEKIKTQIGNENLRNEKVHSFEAGWRARFLDDRLRVSVDLFFNLYRDTIFFSAYIPYRMGFPDIMNSTFRFENEGVESNALGGEAELAWRFPDNLSLWCNIGLRYVVDKNTDERMPSEPTLRLNFGGRYSPESGLTADVAFHYVSEYEMYVIDPENVFDNPEPIGMGNDLRMLGRLGYRLMTDGDKTLEAGLNIVTPLGNPFREYPGQPIPHWSRLRHMSDFGGEFLGRLVSFYLRGSF